MFGTGWIHTAWGDKFKVMTEAKKKKSLSEGVDVVFKSTKLNSSSTQGSFLKHKKPPHRAATFKADSKQPSFADLNILHPPRDPTQFPRAAHNKEPTQHNQQVLLLLPTELF